MTDRELDALVRDKVFAFKWDETKCRVCGWTLAATVNEGCVPGNCSLRPGPDIPAADRCAPYSTDVSAAFLVVDEMARRGFLLQLTLRAKPDLWMAAFGRKFMESVPAEQAVGAARAICLAALAALGVPVAEDEGR